MSHNFSRPEIIEKESDFYSTDFPLSIDIRTYEKKEMELTEHSKLHWHDFFEIEILASGECLHVLNNQSFKIGRGDAYVMTPVNFHNIFALSERFTMYHIAFELSAISDDIAAMLTADSSAVTPHFSEQECKMLFTNLDFLIEQFKYRKPSSKYIMRAGVEQIIVWILQKSDRAAPKQSSTEIDVIQQSINYIRLHFRNTLHMYEIAQMYHLSSNYFGELFKSTVGMSFNAYLSQIRLEYAYNLLITTKMSVNQICYESGFGTVSYFCKEFQNKYGVTPSKFRKEHLENNKPTDSPI